MKKLALLFLSLSFIACQNEKKTINSSDPNETDQTNLSFTYDSVKVLSSVLVKGNENTSNTTKAVISYPVFTDQKINEFVEQKVMNLADEGEHYATYKDFTNAFIKNFDTFSKE